MAPPPTLLSPSELSYLHTSLASNPPIRPDARSPTSFRPLVAETDLVPSANGSARLCFADGTEAIVGVKAEIEKLQAVGNDRWYDNMGEGPSGGDEEMGDGGEEGIGEDKWIEVVVDVPGQRDDDTMVVFLAQMIHEGLVADGGLRNRLVINRRWHWRLYIDILLLSQPHTYPLPLLSLTTHLALRSARLPAPISAHDEDPLFNDDWDASLPLYPQTSASASRPPITLLVISVGSNIFFDASFEELAVADAVLAVTVGAPPSPSTTSPSPSPLTLLAVRTIDPPSRLSASAADTGKAGAGSGLESGSLEGVWRARKGGMKRGVVGRMLRMCVEEGGVGEEVLKGLRGFG
ncbi:ribosomal protein S5 domain 2-type protein [Usnea florida]